MTKKSYCRNGEISRRAVMMVTIDGHGPFVDFSHAFDFSEGQKEEAAVREVHPYCLSVTEVKNIKQSISKWVRV